MLLLKAFPDNTKDQKIKAFPDNTKDRKYQRSNTHFYIFFTKPPKNLIFTNKTKTTRPNETDKLQQNRKIAKLQQDQRNKQQAPTKETIPLKFRGRNFAPQENVTRNCALVI